MADTPSIGINVLPSMDAATLIELARLADHADLAFIGLGDSQMIWDELYVMLGALAVSTANIALGPFVTNPVTRHFTVTASAMRTLAELTGQRAFLGIGYGDSALRTIGRSPATRERLERSIESMRRLWSGISIEGEAGTSLHLARPAQTVPVWLAADGPRSLEQAGAVADMVIANALQVPGHIDFVRDHVRSGARSAGRSAPALLFQTAISIDQDSAIAVERAKSYVARTLLHDVSRWLPGWTDQKRARFTADYDYYRHLDPGHDLAALVPDELVRYKAVAGTSRECADQLRWIAEAGFEHISLVVLGDPLSTVRQLTAEVLPLI